MHPHPPRRRPTAVRAALPLAVAAALTLSTTVAANAATTDPNPNALERANATLSRTAAAQGMVLLENRGNALPMPTTGRCRVFGVGAYKTVKGGTGSGNVNNRYTISVRQGLEDAGYTIDHERHVLERDEERRTTTSTADAGQRVRHHRRLRLGRAAADRDIGRADGGHHHRNLCGLPKLRRGSRPFRRTKGDYYLTDIESADIAIIAHTYKKVVVVLNVGAIVDTTFYTT